MASNNLLNSPLVKELVTCKVCSKFYNDPKILPCQHSFCGDCIQLYFDKKELEARRKLMSLRCPECFTPTAIPLGGIAFFPADNKADKIKNLLQDMMMQSILRNKTDLDSGRPRSSSTSKSRPHSCNIEDIDLNTLASELKIEKGAESLNKTMPVHKVGLDLLSTKEAGTSTKEDTAIHKLLGCGLQDCGIQTELCDVGKGLKDENPITTDDDEGYDTLMARKRTRDTLNAKPTVNGVSHSKRSCQESDTYKPSSQYREQRDYTEVHNTEPYENTNGTVIGELNNNCNDTNGVEHVMKTHNMEGAETNGDVCNGTNGEVDIDAPEKVYLKEPQMVWSVEKNEHEMPTDILVTPNGGVTITDYGNCKIQYFENNGEYIHSIDNIKPFAIAYDKTTDHFVVADRKDKSIKVYDQGGGMVYDWEKNSFHWICGLAVTSTGDFVIFDRELTKIGVYNQEGTRLSEFGKYGDGDSHLCMADFLAVDSHDRVIVCDSGHHCIKVFDTKGCFLGRFSERGTGPGQLLWPKSVCVDSSDNILVTDQRNNRISLFSPDGRFIQQLLPNCSNPYNVSLNQSGTLGVTSYGLGGSSCVRVYQL